MSYLAPLTDVISLGKKVSHIPSAVQYDSDDKVPDCAYPLQLPITSGNGSARRKHFVKAEFLPEKPATYKGDFISKLPHAKPLEPLVDHQRRKQFTKEIHEVSTPTDPYMDKIEALMKGLRPALSPLQ